MCMLDTWSCSSLTTFRLTMSWFVLSWLLPYDACLPIVVVAFACTCLHWQPLIDTCHTACCMCRLNLNRVGHSSLQLQHIHFQDQNPLQSWMSYMACVHKCVVITAWHGLESQDVLGPNFSSFKEINDQLAGLFSQPVPAKAYQLSGLMSSQDQVLIALQTSMVLLACMHVCICVLGQISEGNNSKHGSNDDSNGNYHNSNCNNSSNECNINNDKTFIIIIKQ